MKLSVKLTILLACFSQYSATFFKENITDFTKCKVHYSRQEQNYNVFYHLADQNQSDKDNSTILDFHFSVLSISDAHILLAPSSQVSALDPVYEIVIGAGGNTFSDIRRKMKSNVRQSVRIKGLLSPIDIKSFWIHIYRDGTIDVGREGEELGFLSWRDTDPLPLEVFSFCTWGNVEAKWFFDCPRGNESTDSKEIEPVITDLERLRRHMLIGYNPYVRPVYDVHDKTEVSMSLKSHFVTLDEKASTMHVKGTVMLEWEDKKLKWIPAKYGDIASLHLYQGEIWKPDVVIFNSVPVDRSETFQSSLLVVSSDGIVNWTPRLNSYTFCNIQSLDKWPNDVHECVIDITFGNYLEYMQLKFDSNTSDPFGERYSNDWDIISAISTSSYGWYEYSDKPDPPALRLTLKLKRVASIYAVTLFAPYVVCAVCLLLCFCASPFGYLKITLTSIHLILTTMVLIGLAYIIPTHPATVPHLIQLYCFGLINNIYCLFIAIIVINVSRTEKQYNPPYLVTKILYSRVMEVAMVLPSREMADRYGNLKTDVCSKKPTIQETWIRLGTVIDRLGLLIHVALNVYITIFH